MSVARPNVWYEFPTKVAHCELHSHGLLILAKLSKSKSQLVHQQKWSCSSPRKPLFSSDAPCTQIYFNKNNSFDLSIELLGNRFSTWSCVVKFKTLIFSFHSDKKQDPAHEDSHMSNYSVPVRNISGIYNTLETCWSITCYKLMTAHHTF